MSQETTPSESDHAPRRRRWLHVGLAACSAVLLFAAQQLYFDIQDAQQDALGDAASIAAFMDLAAGHSGAAAAPFATAALLAQAVARFNHVQAATYCDGPTCVASDPSMLETSCTRWRWKTVCAEARSATTSRAVSVNYALADAHWQTLRDFAFLSAILAVVAAVWTTAATRMQSRVAAAERESVFAASHDPLTRLPNRAAFEARAQALLRGGHNAPAPVLLYIDLTGFQDINDNLGHHTGDLVLQLAAERIQRGLGPQDLVARLGGDEFGVVLHRPAPRWAEGGYVQQLMQMFREPAAVEEHTIAVGLSIGAVTLDAGVPGFREAMRCADVALYEAKRQGAGALVHFSRAMDAAARSRFQLQHELKDAVPGGQLFLEYQPQVVGSGALQGVEALVRWRHPTRGLVRPDEFIGVAEQSGLIGALGLAVVRMACLDLLHARRQGMHLPYISVNVSPKQLADAAFVDALLAELQPHNLGSRDLELEITESSLVQSRGCEEQAIRRLADLGFRIAVDDFGTGYSSLSRLHSMPVDKLKMDRSFVTPLPGGKHERAIPESILGLAQKLGLKTVAEGVETAEQAAWLHAAGCVLMQGYYFAKPMPIGRLVEWEQARHASPHQQRETVWAATRPFVEA